jgi:DNA-binding transcriptional MerR regulator
VIRTNGAAAILGVSASTLRSWERRYGFPRPHRTEGGHRHYELEEIEALKQALAETHNASSAVSLAQRRGLGAPSRARLAEAFAAFDERLADRLLEESLALRSVERTVEELLLPAVAELARTDPDDPAYQLAWRHATGWLSAQKRLAPPAAREDGILIIDAWRALDLDTLHAQALELGLRRAGLRTLSLSPTIERARLGRALRALDPSAVVLSGRGLGLDQLARFVFTVRGAVPGVAVFDFRSAVPDTGASTLVRLGEAPAAACEGLLAWLKRQASPAAQVTPRPRATLSAVRQG